MKQILIILFFILTFFITLGLNELDERRDEFNLFSSIENLLTNLRFNFREGEVENPNFKNNKLISKESKIIAIDQESLNKIGKWPWKRNVHAEFLEKIEKFSPSSIHIDILFNLEEEVPNFNNQKKLFQERKKDIESFDSFLKELDNEFSKTLKKYDNIYIDQQLTYNIISIFDESFTNKLTLNEKILEKDSITPNYQTLPIFNSTEPLVEKFLIYSKLGIVNATTDRDEVLRKATLIYPYKNLKNKEVYLSSIYIQLVKQYFSITSKDIEVYQDHLIFKNALAPILDSQTRDPLVNIVDFEKIKNKITKFKNKKYDNNLYNLFVIIFNTRYKNDALKTPDYPIKLFLNSNNQYELLNGKEIYDAALKLNSKKIKVIFYTRKDIRIPLIKNKDGNPFAMNINYANREDITINNQGKLTSRLLYPINSYSPIYFNPSLPNIPSLESLKKINIDQFKEWFKSYIYSQKEKISKAIFKKNREINDNLIIQFALEENPYEGSFFFYDLYLNKYKGVIDKQTYKNFIDNFFTENNLDMDHPLINDFLLDEAVILDFLIDEYLINYNNFYDKILFVGAFALGMARDIHKTTYDEMFGITTILNAFNTIIKQNFLRNSTSNELYLILFFLCFSFSYIYYYLINYLKYIFFFFSSLTILYISITIFDKYDYLLNTTPLLFANLTLLAIITLYTLLYEERDKKYLKDIFSNYLAPEVIDSIYQSKQSIKLGGDEKNITAFFTDIQGFSSFSEVLTAEQLVELLNEYLGAMTDILLAEEGTLDKYEGDAIIAFYGAPLEIKDAAYRACKTAILMQNKLIELREKWKKEETKDPNRIKKKVASKDWAKRNKWPKLVHNMKMRIGINSGMIVVGNMGSEKRKNYTMMGDDVNLAARLESAAKKYGVYVVASYKTFNQEWKDNNGKKIYNKNFFAYRLIDKVVVVGKKEPVEIYEIISLKEKATEQQKKLIKLFNQGLKSYYDKQFDQALEFFEESKKIETFPKQKINPSKIFIKRCKANLKNIKKLDFSKWDGVYHLNKK